MLRTFSSLHFLFALKPGTQVSMPDVKGVVSSVSRVLASCAFGHRETLRTRDKEGYLALECAECGHVRRVLQQPAIKGPRFHAAPLRGVPVTHVRRVTEQRTGHRPM